MKRNRHGTTVLTVYPSRLSQVSTTPGPVLAVEIRLHEENMLTQKPDGESRRPAHALNSSLCLVKGYSEDTASIPESSMVLGYTKRYSRPEGTRWRS